MVHHTGIVIWLSNVTNTNMVSVTMWELSYVYICVGVYMWTNTPASQPRQVCFSVCMCVSVCVLVCVIVYACVCVIVYACVCVIVYACVLVCV